MTYTEIYTQILESIKKDNYPEGNQVWAAKAVTDSLWKITLLFNSPQSISSDNTLAAIKDIIENRFSEPVEFS